MNTLSVEQKVRVLNCLIEGNSIRSTVRITGAAKNTVRDLIREVGPACEAFQRAYFRDLTCKQVEADEVWSFCGMKQKRVPAEMRDKGEVGNIWTFTAICPDCKLIAAWRVGPRDLATANLIMADLALAMRGKFQLSTDAYESYTAAVVNNFRAALIDYGTITKEYRSTSDEKRADRRYSPGRLVSVKKRAIIGDPDEEKICTSIVERMNLSIRMTNRRYTRLTNAFSKRVEMHRHSIAMTFFAYNFIKKHGSLKGKTPAMAAGITDHAFTVRDMLFAADTLSKSAA
ncbi:MAG TPA: IS1 family transposase [Thermoanaerobaculia bacterium]|nr:IS1 family transposase [Thermoanaerobaculia bacterium]